MNEERGPYLLLEIKLRHLRPLHHYRVNTAHMYTCRYVHVIIHICIFIYMSRLHQVAVGCMAFTSPPAEDLASHGRATGSAGLRRALTHSALRARNLQILSCNSKPLESWLHRLECWFRMVNGDGGDNRNHDDSING